MEIISSDSQDVIRKAATALQKGNLVAFPTETVYGLGADATNQKAINRIYTTKGRPSDHPLIIHILSLDQMYNWAIDIPDYAIKLAIDFWPGPMTLVLKRSKLAKDFITGNQNTVGIRVPAHPLSLLLLSEFSKIGGIGIAAPSANRFGAISATSADNVLEELGRFFKLGDLIIDGGKCLIGIESTIIDCTKNVPGILRPGAITKLMIESATGLITNASIKQNKIRASGLLDSHYSPKAKVILNQVPESGSGFLALANIPTPIGVIRLDSPATIEEYARNLYEALRRGDKYGLKYIIVIEPDGPGLAKAIRDRVGRAAAGN